jgi:ribonuclease P protein component
MKPGLRTKPWGHFNGDTGYFRPELDRRDVLSVTYSFLRWPEHEKNVPAEQQKAQENTRFPCPDEDQKRSGSSQEQKAQRQEKTLGCMNERLKPCERIRRKKDFLSLYKEGGRFRGRYLNLVYLPNSLGFSRVAVVVSKKVGGAVERNRAKRWMRETFRKNKRLVEEPTDFLIIARKEIGEADRGGVAEDFVSALGKILEKRRRAS